MYRFERQNRLVESCFSLRAHAGALFLFGAYDCSVGKYLYQKLKEKGITELIFRGKSETHEPYLKKMGYVKSGDVYLREL